MNGLCSNIMLCASLTIVDLDIYIVITYQINLKFVLLNLKRFAFNIELLQQMSSINFKLMHCNMHKIMQLLNSSGKFQHEILNLSPFAPLVLNPTQLKKQHKLLKISSILKKNQRNLRPFAKGIDIVDLNLI